MHNDLQPVVVGRYPQVGDYLNWLGQHAEARMTGSGACVFAAFASEDAANRVLEDLPDDMTYSERIAWPEITGMPPWSFDLAAILPAPSLQSPHHASDRPTKLWGDKRFPQKERLLSRCGESCRRRRSLAALRAPAQACPLINCSCRIARVRAGEAVRL